MEKTAIVGFTEGYAKTVGKYPLLEGALLGGAGGLAGWAGTRFLTPKLINTLMAGKSQAERDELLRQLEEDGTLELISKINAGLGAMAGMGYSAAKHMDFRHGLKGAIGSMTDPTYYTRNSDKIEALEEARAKQYRDAKPYKPLHKIYRSGRTPMKQKVGSYGMHEGIAFGKERVPISSAINLINEDPFLTLDEKAITNTVLEGAEGSTSGLVSGKDLMRSAIHLGVGAGTGFIFGRAASSILSLPPVVTKRLSSVGALAGAITNTGIFSEIAR